MNKLVNWLKYYRASLIDGDRGIKNNTLSKSIQRNDDKLSHLTPDEILEIWDNNKIFKYNFTQNQIGNNRENLNIDKQENDTLIEINKIEIAPIYLSSNIEHGYKIGESTLHYPYWIPAYIDKLGNLYPPKEGELPLFIRNYLAPSTDDVPTISDMELLDKQMFNRNFNIYNWNQYWSDCELFFKDVTGKNFKDFKQGNHNKFTLSKLEENNTTRNILALYNELIHGKNSIEPSNSLLKKIFDVKVEPENHTLYKNEIFANPQHFGHMSGEFPLSSSQRLAFAQFTSKHNKQTFAINGPPGTGKTTILQSFIANIITLSVLEKREAPLIIGCSTNNQAITNILDSMKLEETSDLLSKRWLPHVNSFGLYLTSSRKNEANKEYQIVTSNFFNDGFIGELDDTSKIKQYENYFIEKYINYFSEIDYVPRVETSTIKFDCAKHILKKIKNLKHKIIQYQKITFDKFEIPIILERENFESIKNLLDEITKTKYSIEDSIEKQNVLNNYKKSLSIRQKEFPFYIKWLPFDNFRKIRSNSYKLILKSIANNFPENFKWHNFHLIIAHLESLILKEYELQTKYVEKLDYLNKLKKDIDNRNANYHKIILHWNKIYNEKWKNLIKKTGNEYNNLNILEDIAVKLDISYRNELFWLCVHYREWEFIQDLKTKDSESKERGEKSYLKKLKRVSKVSPLFISTFHTLPKFCTYYNALEGNKFYKELFDLMIIDEVGQVSPEVAIPSLTFTKKILAVGDIYQIEPVWNITKGIDYVNAIKYDIIKNEKDFEIINGIGLTASNGNLMKIIKKATPFSFIHKNGELEKGAYLLEHRRCLDPIIEFSKENVYKGSLKLMVGDKHNKKHDLPPFGYVHVEGYSEKHNGYSRKNIKEAKAIIQWIINHKDKLEQAYNKPLNDIIAIITPFSAQKLIIKNILNKFIDRNISDKLIIGTVHSLQGAERPIILFSTVHDPKDKTLFFNYQGKFNMLNVAITRAKHSFIVIGNMNILNPKDNSPAGKLGAVLFSKQNYALSDNFIYQSEIVYEPNTIDRIDTLDKHRRTLKKCFKIAKSEIIIFSPFISIRAIKKDNIISLINEATEKGVKVTILTDKYLDKVKNQLKQNSKQGRTAIKNTKANLKVINGIHNKTICVDNYLIIEGSFNWLSATRDRNSPYYRDETSVVIQGSKVKEYIKKIKSNYILNK